MYAKVMDDSLMSVEAKALDELRDLPEAAKNNFISYGG
jgi:hypothetical protein